MKQGLILPIGDGQDPTAFATRAEKLEYDSVWMGELWGIDSFVQLTEIACETDDIGLATGIVNVFSRSPAVLAMAAATLNRISGDRMTLGLGVSTPKAIEDLHGMEFHRPVRRTHETVELIKEFTGPEDERITYEGELFEVADFPGLDSDVPVFNAALGEANRRATGRVCDGWIPHNVPFSELEDAFETVETAALEAGRDPDDITVAPNVPVAVSETESEARGAIREHIAYYVGSGEGYKNAVASRFGTEADSIANAWQNGERDEAAELVTDEMISNLGIAGTPQTAREQLRELQDIPCIDQVLFALPVNAADTLGEQTVEALAPTNVTQ